jgi:hypothetical protein
MSRISAFSAIRRATLLTSPQLSDNLSEASYPPCEYTYAVPWRSAKEGTPP